MKTFIASLSIFSLLFITACSGAGEPLTKQQQADKHNLSMEEFDEMNDAAARMNMTMDEHMKMMEE